MISATAQDLYTKISAVPALTGKVGLTLGGKSADPSLSMVALPAAWIVFKGMSMDPPPGGVVPTQSSFLCSFSVMLYLPYVSQSDLIATQYPLLEEVIAAVRGTKGPNGLGWAYSGCQCRLINPDRLAYEFMFEIVDFI